MMEPWVDIPKNSDFSIHNIPFGIFFSEKIGSRVGVSIGDKILDLVKAFDLGIFQNFSFDRNVFDNNYLNDFISLGKLTTSSVRLHIQSELCNKKSILRKNEDAFIDKETIKMQLPVLIRDYTDFYSSIEHATNVGKMFRDPENALLPNWRHLPVGYHGRASSIVVSNTPIRRPKGQVIKPNTDMPVLEPSSKLDFELEMGFIIGKSTKLGCSLTTDNAEDYIFGKVLFNDWSARDIQKWEYVPLGPFLSKNFASSISPWVVTMEALEPFRVAGPKQQPEVLPYLSYRGLKNFDINLEVSIKPLNKNESLLSSSNFKYMYWNMAQQLTHHTINGCNLNVGDLMASGTISGRESGSYGSMLELSWGGKNPIKLESGETRSFIEDFDTIIMKGHCEKNGIRVGFGEVRSQLLPCEY
jgi:fumarylacetoacetase